MPPFIDLILDESKWLPAVLVVTMTIAMTWLINTRGHAMPARTRVACVMNLACAGVIGLMGFGHLLAVATKLAQGTLEGSPTLLFLLGGVLVVPAAGLAFTMRPLAKDERRVRTRVITLNAWLGIALLALGVHNAPLVVPAALNIVFALHTHRVVGWTIAITTGMLYVGLLIGSLVFLASGTTFEEFRGMG